MLYEERSHGTALRDVPTRDPMPETPFADAFSLREEERLLKGALGCAIPRSSSRASGYADAVERSRIGIAACAARPLGESFTHSGAPSSRKSRGPRKGVPPRQRAEERGPLRLAPKGLASAAALSNGGRLPSRP